MLGHRRIRLAAVASILVLVLLSCSIEEDLRIHSDGSGTYRVRISVPKQLGTLDDLRREGEKDGFQVDQQGETLSERFIVFRKNFTDITSLNDSYHSFELTTTDSGFLRRDYRLRASLRSSGMGGYRRRLVVSMPGTVQSATAGEIAGSRVTWEGFHRGTIEIAASGYYLPISRSQRLVLVIAVIAALLAYAATRRRRPSTTAAACCPACNVQLASDARFCRVCGASAPVIET